MNKSELVEQLTDKIIRMPGFTDPKQNHKIAKTSVDVFFQSIKEALKNGDRVEIRGLGSFALKEYKSYTGRNPKTGDKVKVPPKKLPVFKPGKELKKRVNGQSY